MTVSSVNSKQHFANEGSGIPFPGKSAEFERVKKQHLNDFFICFDSKTPNSLFSELYIDLRDKRIIVACATKFNKTFRSYLIENGICQDSISFCKYTASSQNDLQILCKILLDHNYIPHEYRSFFQFFAEPWKKTDIIKSSL